MSSSKVILFMGVMSMLLMNACFEAPDFPVTPVVTFKEVVFIQAIGVPGSSGDTLKITFDYQDGDGDLGLNNTLLSQEKFRAELYPIKEGGFAKFNGNVETPYSIEDIGTPINLPQFGLSEIPPYEKPFSCINWEEIPGASSTDPNIDTIFFLNNPNANNLFIKLYKKSGDSDFEEFVWLNEFPDGCIDPLNTRMPVLKVLEESAAPINGTMTYSFGQVNLSETLKEGVWKIELYIQDRELNQSDITSSGEFTLAEIRGN